jgi:hypothetical protein
MPSTRSLAVSLPQARWLEGSGNRHIASRKYRRTATAADRATGPPRRQGKLRTTIVSYLNDHVSQLLTGGSCQEETGRQGPPHAASCPS